MPLRAFEQEILDQIKGPPGQGAIVPRTGVWVRGHLLDVGEDNPSSMFRAYREFVAEAGIRRGSYHSFLNNIYLLRRLELIERTGRKEPGTKNPEFSRVFYSLVKAKLKAPAWERAYQSLYPSTDLASLSPTEKAALRQRYPRRRRGAALPQA